ncbi:CoA transferase [Yinghuangia sp. ASG 101]|uniref:CaiB/BaiF CoA transferase family protein n=1 Tax=Yinghuangia sp. ASG 101 TaxID=2896848 RepID=UPI001E44496B|nr:CoA transferase [Yinghuangia sp. ASG 101]UGQ11600.1 CoA transferase [Yinghuangia sp. ASG 101]
MAPAHRGLTPGALDGVRIVDFSRVLAGPHATMLLADLGAEVAKIERPGAGDDTRQWGPPWHEGEATYYLGLNRNKTSAAYDLTDPEHCAEIHELVAGADVVVENFRPGTMDRLGLGYGELSRRHPHLVYCSITGFGADKGAHLPGYDLIAQAVGGLMSITGHPDGEPTKAGVALVDVITGLHATIGILAALRHRERTGEGQRVEVNLLSSLLAALTNQASAHILTGAVPTAMGNAHPSVVPYQPVRTADRSLAIAAATNRQYAQLTRALGRPELADDERFATNAARVRNREALIAELEATFTRAGADHWFGVLSAAGVPCGPINNLEQAFTLAADLGLEPVVHPADGSPGAAQVRNPITLSATPAVYRTPPPPMPG